MLTEFQGSSRLSIDSLDLLVHRRGKTGQLSFFEGSRERVTELPVDPVEDIDGSFPGEAESGFPVGSVFRGDEQCQTLSGAILIHELCNRADIAGKQASADKLITQFAEFGWFDRSTDTFR